MNQFIFLYPTPKIIDYELGKGGAPSHDSSFKEFYSAILNKCVDDRYRQKGFAINYAIPKEGLISDVIDLQLSDIVIEVGRGHQINQKNGDYILDQLGEADHLRVAGFHMWDCVDSLAKIAYERGLNVLVDEDLTEFLSGRLSDDHFRTDRYPTYNARELGDNFDSFMEARKDKPWLWQKY